MTSNVGASAANEAGNLGFDTGATSTAEAYAYRATKAAYMSALQDTF